MPRTKCPHCGWKGEVEKEYVGQNLICPECQNEFTCKALKKRKPGGFSTQQRPKQQNTAPGRVNQKKQAPVENSSDQPVTVGNWLLTYLLVSIPLVGLIMLFVWGFGGGAPTSKANWAKASLLWMLICTILTIAFYVVVFVVILGAAASVASDMPVN